ncbi:NACHT domain- and WD repeat-containing protein 1-like [Glandiceps talaboti]
MEDPDIYKALIRGDMRRLPPQDSNIVRIFVSSTFTDMVEERNKLMRDAFPVIRSYCQRIGLEFEVVDMRWGIPDEASTDHTTSELCMREISNCQRLSKGPIFVVFLGNKYGYRPLPSRIEAERFEKLRELSKSTVVLTDVQLLDDWYVKDTNAVPAEYILQPITNKLPHFNNDDPNYCDLRNEHQSKWWDTHSVLRNLLRSAADLAVEKEMYSKDEIEPLYLSVTENEVRHGIINNPNTSENCLCFLREIEDAESITNNEEARLYIDLNENGSLDTEAQHLLSELKQDKIRKEINVGVFKQWTVPWSSNGVDPTIPQHDEYLQDLCELFTDGILKLIDKASKQTIDQTDNSLYKEVVHHALFCETKCSTFRGRQGMLQSAGEYIKDGNLNKPLCIYGKSGSGKTSVVAMIAKHCREWSTTSCVCVLRFLGTSPQSCTIHQTLQSVCKQICEAYDQPLPSQQVLQDYSELVHCFRNMLTTVPSIHNPLVLILDSIDQLSPNNDAHTLNWLPKTIPSHVRIFVSMLPEEHNCLNNLRKSMPDERCYLEMKPLTAEMGREILDAWLISKQRTITDNQREAIIVALEGCPQPLFLKIAFENLMHWKSYTPVESITIAKSVREAIEMLFEGLEKKYGAVLVSRALAYITASKDGITEAELEDVLSLDDSVLDAVYQYWDPPSEGIIRIPSLLWKRIRYDINEYLVERDAGGKTVLAWYHRQFIETASSKYLGDQGKAEVHSILSEYFLGTFASGVYKSIKLTKREKTLEEVDRQVAAQPLEFGQNVFNLRKLSELPYHLLLAGKIQALKEEVLCKFDWILTKLRGTSFLELIGDYQTTLKLVEDETVQLVHDALMLASSNLKYDPYSLAGQLIGRLHGMSGENNKHLVNLVEQARNWCTNCQRPLVAPRTGCLIPPGGPLKTTLAGHPRKIDDLSLTTDDKFILSTSQAPGNECMVNVWNLQSGEVTYTLKLPFAGQVQMILTNDNKRVIFGSRSPRVYDIESGEHLQTVGSDNECIVTMALSSDDQYLCIITANNEMKLIQLLSNTCITSIMTNHKGAVKCLCLSDDDSLAITGGKDNMVKVFCLKTGKILRDFTGHTGSVTAVTVCLSNSKVVSGSEDSTLQIWELNDMDKGPVTVKAHSKLVTILKSIQKGALVISGSKDQTLKLWDVQKQVCLHVYEGHQDAISCLSITDDEKYMVSGSKDDFLKIWNIDSGICLNTLEGHSSWISCVSVTHDSKSVVSASNDKTIKLWKLTDDTNVIRRERHATQPRCCGITSDGNVAISGAKEDKTRIWSHENGACVLKLPCDSACMVTTTDGAKVITASADKIVRVWNIHTGEAINTFEGHEREITCLAISKDNRYLISACKQPTMRKWDLETGKGFPVWDSSNKGVKCLQTTPDSLTVVSGHDDGTVKLWDIDSGHCVKTVTGHTSAINCIAITPNGRFFMTGSTDKTARIGNTRSGKSTDVLTDFGDSVQCFGITSDSGYLIAGSHESSRQLKKWSINNKGICTFVGEFTGHNHAVMTLHITENDKFLISGSRDCNIKVWDVHTRRLLASFDFQSQVKCLAISKEIGHSTGLYKGVATNKSGMVGFFDLMLSSALNPATQDNGLHPVPRDKPARKSATCDIV